MPRGSPGHHAGSGRAARNFDVPFRAHPRRRPARPAGASRPSTAVGSIWRSPNWVSSAALIRVSASSSAHHRRRPARLFGVLRSAPSSSGNIRAKSTRSGERNRRIAVSQDFTDANKDRWPRPARPPALILALIGIALSRSRICFACQPAYQVKEPVGLADKQPVGREGFYSRHRTAFLYRGRPNDRNRRELSAEERARLGHDQVGSESPLHQREVH